MKPRTLSELADVCQGRLEGGSPEALVSGVSTDSRALRPGELFVALKGEVHDGHEYAAAACERGAAGLVVARPVAAACPQIVVPDTLRAYGLLGAAERRQSSATFLACTGSAGKTTCKGFLGSICSLAGPALVAPGNENNEIAVPRLLLQLQPDHRYCVLELAMRASGEIAYLAALCRPQVGIITNIGEAHLGRLGSREAIARTKAELLEALPADGVAVLNSDDFFYGVLSELAPCPVASFGFGEAPEGVSFHAQAQRVRASGVEPARFALRLGLERRGIELQMPGRHNVSNALAAAAAAHAVGIPLEAIKVGLETFPGVEMRSRVLHAPGGFAVVDDAYNASPTSTPAALQMLGGCPGRRVFVFGDMLELGSATEAAHRAVGRQAVEVGVDWVVAVGPYAALAAEEAETRGVQADAVADAPAALALLRGALGEGDTVLVKASRGTKLEGVVKGLLEDA